jgi:hypothetical protein
MKRRCALVAVMATSVAAFARAETNAPLISAVSVTRQFSAYAPGPVLPSALCIFAERTKSDWLNLLGTSDHWHDEIAIVIRERTPRTANRPAAAIGVVRFGQTLHYEIDGYIPPPLDEQTLGEGIVEALCLEFANREHPDTGAIPWKNPAIPPWLTQGLTEAIHGRVEWLVSVARRAAASARPPSARDILNVPSLPASVVDRELFSANAWLLTEGLLRLPNGQRKLQQFLASLQRAPNATAVFHDVYDGDFADAVALEKWWALEQARLASVVIAQNWTTRDTVRRLDELLVFDNGVHFDQLLKHSEEAWLQQALPERIQALQILLNRAQPIFRPVLEAYVEAGQWLAEGKLSRYHRTVERAETLRVETEKQMQSIDNVLDQAEEKYAGDISTNAFRGYFQTLDQLDSFERQRRNPISDYLDQFDR